MAKPFAIGLTMTGAISAGTYTAGVLDFLLEALDQWEAAKAGELPPDERGRVPWHDVVISVPAARRLEASVPRCSLRRSAEGFRRPTGGPARQQTRTGSTMFG